MTTVGNTWRTGTNILCAVVLSSMLGACSRQPITPGENRPGKIYVLLPADDGPRIALMTKILQETFPSAIRHSTEEFSSVEHDCLAESGIMVIAGVESFPVHLWRPLEHYLQSGGQAVFWGAAPFGAAYGNTERAVRAGASEDSELLKSACKMGGRSSIQLWSSRASAGEEAGISKIVRPDGVTWDAVEVNIAAFREFNMLISTDSAVPERNAAAFCFFAYGDSNTTSLALQCEAEDGAVWRLAEPLDREWRLHVVPWSRFRCEGDASGGGGGSARMESINRLSIGLNNAIAPQWPGPHQYGLSDVRVLSSISGFFPDWPDIPMLSPPFNRASAETAVVQSMVDDTQIGQDEPVGYDSPMPLLQWITPEADRGLRCIPLYGGVNQLSEGENGWVASIYVEERTGEKTGVWGWVGMPPDDQNRRWIGSLLASCVARLRKGVFLIHAPSVPAVIAGNQPLEVEVAWKAPLERGGRIRVVGELLAVDGRRLRRVISPMVAAADMTNEEHKTLINLGRMPTLQSGAQDYCVRIALEDVSAQETIYDESRNSVKVSGVQKAPAFPWLKCSGSRFVSERQAVYIMGIRYNPLDNLMLPQTAAGQWLESPWFCPERVKADMVRLSEMNINAILVPYEDAAQAEGLHYLIHEAGSQGLRVALEMKCLNPVHPDFDQAEALIRAATLDSEPGVFALFFAPEQMLGTPEERAALDGAWREWLTDQFGSLARAEKMMGKPTWQRDGLLAGPSNEDLAGRGKHSVATIVYRRFVDDYLSRRYGWLKRFIRSLGCRQLLSAEAYPLQDLQNNPSDFSAGSLHFDFLAPNGAGRFGPNDSFLELGFLTAYGRGGRGFVKPVVWMDFGPSMGAAPQQADLTNQERIYDAFFEMVNRSSAAGTFASCYSSARGPEQDDAGILSPLGETRPVCMTFARHMRRLRSSMIYPATWKGRVFSRSAGPEGLAGLLQEWRGTYAGELAENTGQELRPFGFGKNTTDMPLLTVGGLPHSDPAPFECATAEWGAIWVNGRPVLREPGFPLEVEWGDTVRMALLNSGVAAWSAARPDQQGTVWVRVKTPGGSDQQMAMPMVSPGGEDFIEWTASESGEWRFRASIAGVGDFGETLRVDVGRRGNPGR